MRQGPSNFKDISLDEYLTFHMKLEKLTIVKHLVSLHCSANHHNNSYHRLKYHI